jgi:EAL domain-containing protein (putative c-di-GMP-specific phosphodiesterase class I)
VQFRDPQLASVIRQALAETGLAPDRLEVEITESTLMLDDANTRSVLDELRTLGLKVSMDDFGTGYSSLSYLQNYPISAIKIDRSFVAKLGEQPTAKSIIRTIVALATALDMTTVAEGVETEAQMAELRLLGCAAAQGYFIGRPDHLVGESDPPVAHMAA